MTPALMLVALSHPLGLQAEDAPLPSAVQHAAGDRQANVPDFGTSYQEALRTRLRFIEECRAVLRDHAAKVGDIDDVKLYLAIDGLGQHRDSDSVKLLLDLVSFQSDFRRLTSFVPPDRERDPALDYPAVGALIRIGLPAADACAKRAAFVRDNEQRRRYYWVIGQVFGPSNGRHWLSRELDALSVPGGPLAGDGATAAKPRVKEILEEYNDVFPPDVK